MKITVRKVISSVVAAALTLALCLPALAADDAASSAAPYENIITKLSAEYQDDLEKYGLSVTLSDTFDARTVILSPAEFEAEVRTTLEAAIENNKQVRERYEQNGGSFDDIVWTPLDNADEIAAARAARSTQAYQCTKREQYHKATLTATLYKNPSNGNVTFESINKISSVPNAWDPAFYMSSASHRLIDGARTCEVTYIGDIMMASGYVVHDTTDVVMFYVSDNELL